MPKSALGVLKDFAEKPYTLWDLRGKQFTIIEDLRPNSTIREKQEPSRKTGKPLNIYMIKIEEGVFQKDLQMYDSELEKLFLAMPTTLKTFSGATLKVENNMSKDLKYIGSVVQDMQGTPLGPTQSPGNAPGQTKDQKEGLFCALAQAITFSAKIGAVMTEDKVIQVAQNITKDDPKVFIQAAKMAGWVIERDGIYTGTA